MRAVLDTSVFIALEKERPIEGELPDEVAVSAATIAELALGVAMAADEPERERRLRTLAEARLSAPLPLDEQVALQFGLLAGDLIKAGIRKPKVQDCYIAATALVHGVPVCTQDGDFDAIRGVAPMLVVIRV